MGSAAAFDGGGVGAAGALARGDALLGGGGRGRAGGGGGFLTRALFFERNSQRHHQRWIVSHVSHVSHALEALHRRLRLRRRRRRRESAPRRRAVLIEDRRPAQDVAQIRPRLDDDQIRVIILIHARHERVQPLSVRLDVAERHHVHRHVALAQLLPRRSQRLDRHLAAGFRRTARSAFAGVYSVCVSAPECATWTPDADVDLALDLHAVHRVEHRAQVLRRRREHARRLSRQLTARRPRSRGCSASSRPASRFTASASACDRVVVVVSRRRVASVVAAVVGRSAAQRKASRAARRAHLKPRGGVVGVANVFAVIETQDRGLEDHDARAGGGVTRSSAEARRRRGEAAKRRADYKSSRREAWGARSAG